MKIDDMKFDLYFCKGTRSERVTWAVFELGLEKFTTVDLWKGEHMTPEYASLNPMKSAPILRAPKQQ